MKMNRRIAVMVAVAIALVSAGTGLAVWARGQLARAVKYQTARVDRGAIISVVSASGTLNAVTTVQVGTQVSGQIKELFVDFNSPVEAGQLIARLDSEIFEARTNAARADHDNARAAVLTQQANVEKVRADVESARAGVAAAVAQVARARADIEAARAAIATARANLIRDTATLDNARVELGRRVALLADHLISQSEKDQAQTAVDTAEAQVQAVRAQQRAAEAAGHAAEAQLAGLESQADAARAQHASAQAALGVASAQLQAARATVNQKSAALAQAMVDLKHTEIRAPVTGIVISRAVDVGQTVAASLQAPTLFVIAQDLTRMQAEAAVDEADVSRLREGMTSSFTVDAFPGRAFEGRIAQIRKAPQVVQNVVTYTVVIAVSNDDRTLMPGMTANVRVPVERRDDVVRVPNAALRFRPAADATAGPPGGPGAATRVYVLGPGGWPQAVPVTVGLSDGACSELVRGDLAPGRDVLIGQAAGSAAPTAGGPRLRF